MAESDKQAKRDAVRRAIQKRKPICFDVAAEHGQLFDNVKHLRWFRNAVAAEMFPKQEGALTCLNQHPPSFR